ncbi:MAG TPA: PfaD family polyunsaturated fatty acid/polyketide biosynthesis protein [Candidatus Hydrogenedentes bacterium]|nr:PfaD family polyunsaturated fatty acid/polyketide biosynthesis protein [Candidatus Hydrogenedentota bacterium]
MPAGHEHTGWMPGWTWSTGGDPSARRVDPVTALLATRKWAWALDPQDSREPSAAMGGVPVPPADRERVAGPPILAAAPPAPPESLGASAFRKAHGTRYALYAGSMAHGIASERLVVAMGRAGFLGFFGAAGEPPDRIEAVLARLKAELGNIPFGFNLISSPGASAWEEAVVDIYLRHGLRLVEASAYIQPSPALVRYRVKGIYRGADGQVIAPNRVIAKVSRAEIAERFFAPPPEKILRRLVESGAISPEEAELAAHVPLAEDLTAEADSGGHTDHRAALALLPGMLALRDRAMASFPPGTSLRVGLAGGIATPHAAAAAFAMGADYVVTGTVNQACVESGSSDTTRAMLAEASQVDVAKAPAADMFEMGVTVQVLKKGTRFAERAAKLYDLYKTYGALEEIPEKERQWLETVIFRGPIADIWEETRAFFNRRDPAMIAKAEQDPRRKLALLFRWYLGLSSHWANQGVPDRKEDYQVWCGPGIGAFNEWTRGSFMASPDRREAHLVALNILALAGVLLRQAAWQGQGITHVPRHEHLRPREREELEALLHGSPA